MLKLGLCGVTHRENYHNFSFSGGLLAALRRLAEHRDFVIALASSPHNITRLDVALDVPIAGHIVLDNISKLYPNGRAELCGHERKLQYVLSKEQRHPTGTVYFQDRNYGGNVFLRVYDKAYEVYCREQYLMSPTTRYEFSIKRGASLADYQNPTSIFWHYMPEKLLKAPDGVVIAPWSPVERVEYDKPVDSLTTDYETLRFLIQNSVALRDLVSRCQSVNGGGELLLREVRSALEQRVTC